MSKIIKYDCDVFPLKIWVCVEPSLQQLQNRFVILEDDNVTESEFDDDTIKPYWGACRITVIEKKTRHTGSLVVINRPDTLDLRQIVHEISHAYDDYVRLLGLEPVGETRAYVTEWIFDMVYKTVYKELNVSPKNN